MFGLVKYLTTYEKLLPFLVVLYLSGFVFYLEGNEMPLLEWEYTPPIGPRPARGFVGLKNAGATCYMNSVIQQVRPFKDIWTEK